MNSQLITKLLFLCSLIICCAAQVTADEKSAGGRFLYAADDDWDTDADFTVYIIIYGIYYIVDILLILLIFLLFLKT